MEKFSLATILIISGNILGKVSNLDYGSLIKYAIFLFITGLFIVLVRNGTLKRN